MIAIRPNRRRIFWRFLVAVWGMVTVILASCVVLLAMEMVRQGKDPLALVRTASGGARPALPVTAPSQPKTISLYFADKEGRRLIAELGVVQPGDSTIANCRKTIEALIQGPRGSKLTPILPPSAKVRGLYLVEHGELVVDLSMDQDADSKKVKSASFEALALYGLVNTLTQPALVAYTEGAPPDSAAITRVRFLIEGSTPRESFPAHLDASEPIAPDPLWIAGAAE